VSLRRNIAYAGAAIAVVSGITGIVGWWLPSSATWLNRHGFIAWPLAVLSVLLFVWAAVNWQEVTRELATARAETRTLVPADRQLFNEFKVALPKDSPVLAWLRYDADKRMYRHSNVAPLSDLIYRWRDADEHFVNPELEQAVQRFVEYAGDFLSYQGINSFTAPPRWQNDEKDHVYEYFGPNEGDDRKRSELHKALGERADRVLAAHNELYMIGSRLGL
jgi:hypothetical protein